MENRSNGMLVVGVLVAIAAVAIAFVTSYFGNQEAEETERPVAVVEEPAQQTATGDADGDGVPDWKEFLWGTDAHNPDTDGDGVGDAEEIAQGSSPTISGTDIVDSGYVAPAALTPTEALSREIFAGYSEARLDGTPDQAEIASAVSSALTRNISELEPAPRYTIGDLASVEPDILLSVYEFDLLTAFQKMTTITEYELAVFTRAAQDRNVEDLQMLLGAAQVYKEVVSDLLNMPVPQDLGSAHLNVTNSLSELAHATDGLATWSGDPLDALVRVDAFALAENNFSRDVTILYQVINSLK